VLDATNNRESGPTPDGGMSARDGMSVRDSGLPVMDAPQTGRDTGSMADAGGGATSSSIHHLVVIIQENHTFDNYFGEYCRAAAGSNPSCTTGPSCCEAAPSTEPSGASPVSLTDAENANFSPEHTKSCELEEMNNGSMDLFVSGASCSNGENFA